MSFDSSCASMLRRHITNALALCSLWFHGIPMALLVLKKKRAFTDATMKAETAFPFFPTRVSPSLCYHAIRLIFSNLGIRYEALIPKIFPTTDTGLLLGSESRIDQLSRTKPQRRPTSISLEERSSREALYFAKYQRTMSLINFNSFVVSYR